MGGTQFMGNLPTTGHYSGAIYCCGTWQTNGDAPNSTWWGFSKGNWGLSPICYTPCQSAGDGDMIPLEFLSSGNETISPTTPFDGPTLFGGEDVFFVPPLSTPFTYWTSQLWIETPYGLSPDPDL